MLFNSTAFLVFFPLVTAAYFLLPQRYRWALLLAASCIFYMAFIPAYILILAITILIDYWAGIMIARATGKKRRLYLVVSIIATCLVLFVFKYSDFFLANINSLAAFLRWNYSVELLHIILPIGLSFHTFQSLSYVIEVYRGNQAAEHNFGIYALYVMFYPQLVAGPIERPQNLLHQFYEHHSFEYGRVVSGLKLMTWGMFKKVVIADRLALFVNSVYRDPTDFQGHTLFTATVFFAFQIYCDFSGYSDIARGAARVMGFRLMRNFDHPYSSLSVGEFWRRWHISLSSWFRDYVYVSLGGNRVGPLRRAWNLLVTFLISGLWHGANWTFVVWGALHGSYIVGGIVTAGIRERLAELSGLRRRPALRKALRVVITFGLVCLGWVFFRSRTLSDALYVCSHLFSGWEWGSALVLDRSFGIDRRWLALGYALILLLLLVEALQRWKARSPDTPAFPRAVRWAAYYAQIWGILLFGVFGQNEFIYFQF